MADNKIITLNLLKGPETRGLLSSSQSKELVTDYIARIVDITNSSNNAVSRIEYHPPQASGPIAYEVTDSQSTIVSAEGDNKLFSLSTLRSPGSGQAVSSSNAFTETFNKDYVAGLRDVSSFSGDTNTVIEYDAPQWDNTAEIWTDEQIADVKDKISTSRVTIADDGVHSFTPRKTTGRIAVYDNAGNGVECFFDLDTPAVSSGDTIGNGASATGNHAGTTGTDGNLTVAADGANNQIDIENRTGSSQPVQYIVW